jgi:FAD/FMN-containing dehydrogenase
VLAATLPRGLTPPALTDYLELTVGGALVVGGVGGTSSRHGMVSDNVLELDVVTGRGEKITCSPLRNAGLFQAVRAGLGQVGIITRATLKLVAAPENVRRYVLTYPDLTTLLADERLLAAENRFDALQGSILPTQTGWTFRLDAAFYFSGDTPPDDDALLVDLFDDRSAAQASTLSYFDYLNRLAALEQLLRANGQWFYPHPWLMTFVGDSRIEAVVSGELDRLTAADLAQPVAALAGR